MTPAEFKSTRESLHLTVKWLASHMRVRRQSVQRWENGRFPIPDTVEAAMHDLEVLTQTSIDKGIQDHERVLPVPMQDQGPEDDMPPAWHRMVAKQISDRTGASIEYEGHHEPA